jgi:hypothetical protein
MQTWLHMPTGKKSWNKKNLKEAEGKASGPGTRALLACTVPTPYNMS